jgi:hypothetical protein
MADLRTYFGAVMMVALASLFVATLYSQSIQNGGYSDVGPDGRSNFPLAGQTDGYMRQINQSSIDLTNSMNSTLGQSQNVDITGVLFGGAATTLGAMSIIWQSFMMVISMFGVLITAPVMSSFGLGFVGALGIAYISGLILLVIAGVIFKWFI